MINTFIFIVALVLAFILGAVIVWCDYENKKLKEIIIKQEYELNKVEDN